MGSNTTSALSYNARRIILTVAVLPSCVSLIDNLGQYRWFWPYDRQIMGIAMIVGVLGFQMFAPSISEIRERRTKKDRESVAKMEAYLNNEGHERDSNKT
jgi:hypothetical protein